MQGSWLIMSFGILAVSILLVLAGLRGRRVNDHPICRRCGFDLFGKPAESTVCSECGADLSKCGAVRIGRRERRVGVLAVAVPALILTLGWCGWDGWRRARGVDWNPHKPVWWLAREANGHDPVARDAALTELTRRIGAGRLTHGQEEALVNRALEIQADVSKTWLPAWGSLVEVAHDTGRLSQERWQRYMMQVPTLVLEPERGSVRRCDRLAFHVRTGVGRTGGTKVTRGQAAEPIRIGVYAERQLLVDGRAVEASGFIPSHVFMERSNWYTTELAPAEVEPNQIPLLVTSVTSTPFRVASRPGAAAVEADVGELPGWLPNGDHIVRVKLHLVPLRPGRNPAGNATYVRAGPRRTVEVETAFSVTPAAFKNHDPVLRDAVRRSFSVERLTYRRSGPSGRMEGVLRCGGTPVPVAYEVLIMYSYYQHSAGTACFVSGDFPSTTPLLDPIDFGNKPPDKVSIELIPNRKLAPPDTKEICGSLIILENIPVVHVREPSGNSKAAGGR